MAHYRMRIAYNGTHYAGWQRQPGLRTVQQTVEETLRNLWGEESLTVSSSSRTDAGVHAVEMTLSFHAEKELAADLSGELQRRLPHDLRLLQIEPAEPGFNAHTDALGKAYVYVIRPGSPEIFLNGLCWYWPDAAVNAEVREAVRRLIGTHDFRSFTGRHAETRTVRTIYRAELMEFGPLVCVYLSGDGFLYKMVRRLAGFLYETARGRYDAEELTERLRHPKTPRDDEIVAPACGLYLKKVFYQPGEWTLDRLTAPPFLIGPD